MQDDLSQRSTQFNPLIYQFKNLWTGQILGDNSTSLQQDIAAHDTLILRLTVPGA